MSARTGSAGLNHVGREVASDWVDLESKVVDNAKPMASQGRRLTTIKLGKGKRSRKLRVPRNMVGGGELKRAFSATVWNAQTLGAPSGGTTAFGLFSNIANGTASVNRIGDVIRVQRVVMRGYLEWSSSETFSTASVAVVLDNEPATQATTSSLPAWTEVFQGIGGSTSAQYNVAIPNDNKRWRFNFLRRLTVPSALTALTWNGTTTIAAARPQVFELDIPINRLVEYDPSSAVPYKGCECVVYGWSDVTSNDPKISLSYEIFFTDE